jgi:DNA mismatch endonuclease (patch repair protein)
LTDIYSTKKRSDIMSKISGIETKPEIIVRKFLFSKGFRYRKNDKRYPGKPDIILPKYKTAIFVHGCFWHGHHCKAGGLPETRKEFWTKKIGDTKQRDKKNKSDLEKIGWKVIAIWDCQINTIIKLDRKLNLVLKKILSK